MLKTFSGSNATALFRGACRYLVRHETTRGTAKMMEAPGPVAFELTDPRQNLVQVRERQLNPWVTLAEFPWLLTGRNDLAWLKTYLPRAGDFSDDGSTWRAGYGPRMRRWFAPDRPKDQADQLQYVLDELRQPPVSRRAVMSLWDPRTDHAPGSRDYPCTDLLVFQIRNGDTLDLSVTMRSNDLWWGWSAVNIFNWTTLLRAVAEWKGYRVGNYYHWSDNLHLYERSFAAARAIADPANEIAAKNIESWKPRPAEEQDSFGPEERVFHSAAVRLMAVLERGKPDWGKPEAVPAGSISWLRDWAYFMSLHPHRDDAIVLADKLAAYEGRRQDWCWAALAWAERHEDSQ